MSKIQNLQNALNSSSGRKAAPVAAVTVVSTVPAKTAPAGKAPSRAGMINMSAWLPKEFKQSIRMVQAKDPDATLQDLMAEAFNELFIKRNVPTVAVEQQEKSA